jgi:N-acylneuraminate cytidylyltransferase
VNPPSIVALIPARAGSKRVPGKNIRLLGKHPLIAYTISASIDGGIFADVVVSTDGEDVAQVGMHYGAEVPFLRPAEMAGDHSPDIEWVRYTLERLRDSGREYDCFSILRPTSPFRKPATIHRAWAEFIDADGIDSLRAVELCGQHPGKMWVIAGDRMSPLLKDGPTNPPWHSMQYQSLPKVYVQNASLEIAWTRVVTETDTIAGTILRPFLTQADEGFDVNTPEDWWYAERLLARGEATLPAVAVAPWTGDLPSRSGRG